MEEVSTSGTDPDAAAMMSLCRVLRPNYGKLTNDEKEWFKRIVEKSDLMKNPNPQWGKKRKQRAKSRKL